MRSIQAIPTRWNGITYRSRTEAKWAWFFDAESIPVHYEPEGFIVDGVAYLPDYQFVEAPNLTFFEVKPTRPTPVEYAKLRLLAEQAKAHVFVAHGAPSSSCVVEKVYSSNEREHWFFVYEEWALRCSYLTNNPFGGGFELPLRKSAGRMNQRGATARTTLERAGDLHLNHSPPGRVRASASLRNSKLVRESR